MKLQAPLSIDATSIFAAVNLSDSLRKLRKSKNLAEMVGKLGNSRSLNRKIRKMLALGQKAQKTFVKKGVDSMGKLEKLFLMSFPYEPTLSQINKLSRKEKMINLCEILSPMVQKI